MMIRKDTLTNIVVQAIEREILSGKLLPDSKIKSTRTLAEEFNTSQQVIKSAMAILDERDLIISKPRKGIYVAPNAYNPNKKTVLCLSSAGHAFITSYLENFFCFSNHPKCKNVDFVARSLTEDSFGELSFNAEMKRLGKGLYAGAIVNIPGLLENQIKALLDLPFPVVFVGDFAEKSFPTLSYHQIVEDTSERAETAVAYALERGAKSIACIGGTLKAHYNRLYKDRAQTLANDYDADLHYIEHGDQQNLLHQVQKARFETIKGARALIESADAIIFDGFQKLDWFAEAFAQNDLLFPGKRIVIANGDMHQGCTYMKPDYTQFSKVALTKLMDIFENSPAPTQHVLSGLIHYRIMEVGESHYV